MSVRENNGLPFKHVSAADPVPVPGPIELSFGVLATSPPEQMMVEYAMLTDNDTRFMGATGASVAVVSVTDGPGGGNPVMATSAAGDRVSVGSGKRTVVFNAQLVGAGGAGGVHDVVVEVRVTQGGEYRFRDEVRFSVNQAALLAAEANFVIDAQSPRPKSAKKSRKRKQ